MHLFLLGAGHVGLVTAVGFVRLGHRVTVADVDTARIAALRNGLPPIFEPGLTEAIASGLANEALTFTTELDPPVDTPFTFVCVNTPTGPAGPLSTVHVESAIAQLLTGTGPDHTIVIRSTLPLDGPARIVALAASRPGIGRDPGDPGDPSDPSDPGHASDPSHPNRPNRPNRPSIVTNPEFMREGQALDDFDRPNRVVAGWLEPRDIAATQAVLDLYKPLDAPTLIADARSVALIKLGANVFLGMKVSFANELARVADATGADIEQVIAGIGLDSRIGTAFLRPGPGVGGSCLPEQAIAIALQIAALDVEAPLLSAIHRSTTAHQRQIVTRIETLLGGPGSLAGRRIGLLGLAFKANTDDVRESPALALAANLRAAGAQVLAHDPRATERARVVDPELAVAATAEEAVRGADAVVVATEWPDYGRLDWQALAAAMRGTLVYDTRAVVDVDAARAAGLRVERLGRPGVEAAQPPAASSVAGSSFASAPSAAAPSVVSAPVAQSAAARAGSSAASES